MRTVFAEERTEDRSSPRYPGLLPVCPAIYVLIRCGGAQTLDVGMQVIKVSGAQQRFVTLPQAALSDDQKQAVSLSALH